MVILSWVKLVFMVIQQYDDQITSYSQGTKNQNFHIVGHRFFFLEFVINFNDISLKSHISALILVPLKNLEICCIGASNPTQKRGFSNYHQPGYGCYC